MESELTISQVTKIYGNDKRALNEVSLVLTPGVWTCWPKWSRKKYVNEHFDSEFETNIWNGELLRGRDLEVWRNVSCRIGLHATAAGTSGSIYRRAVFMVYGSTQGDETVRCEKKDNRTFDTCKSG